MPEDNIRQHTTLALSTKLEEDFVASLTATRSALEILRHFPTLGEEERLRFVETALRGCTRLEKSVDELTRTVYAAGQQVLRSAPEDTARPIDTAGYAEHIRIRGDLDIVEIDLSDLVFSSSRIVNDFYYGGEMFIHGTGRRWFFLVNYGKCSVWPEAWVAFAHRSRRLNVLYSLGTAQFDEAGGDGEMSSGDLAPAMFRSREAALAQIEKMKSVVKHANWTPIGATTY